MSSSFSGSDPTGLRVDAMSAALARNWWVIALRGLFAVIFGVLTFVWPGITLLTLVILFAAYMLADGVFAIIAGIRAARRNERWGFLVLEGIADILAGIIAWAWPAITVFVFVYLVAFWAIVSGIFMAIAAFRLHLDHGRWLLVISGLFSILFGVLVAFAPIAGAYVLTIWLGAYALVFGLMLVGLGLRLRKRHLSAAPPSGAAFRHT